MTLVARGVEEAGKELREGGREVQAHEENDVPMLLLPGYRLPPGWSRNETDLLLRLPPSFPAGKPDMFWTEPDVLLSNGAKPKQAHVLETYLGRRWRRFSWHLGAWSPSTDDIWTFLDFIERRLRRVE